MSDTSVINVQPIPTKPTLQGQVRQRIRKVTTRDGWLGEYDFVWLCTPTLPFSTRKSSSKKSRLPPFYALDADLPILVNILIFGPNARF